MLDDGRSKESVFEKTRRRYRFGAVAYGSVVFGGKCAST
jgi:hypothetical protein